MRRSKKIETRPIWEWPEAKEVRPGYWQLRPGGVVYGPIYRDEKAQVADDEAARRLARYKRFFMTRTDDGPAGGFGEWRTH